MRMKPTAAHSTAMERRRPTAAIRSPFLMAGTKRSLLATAVASRQATAPIQKAAPARCKNRRASNQTGSASATCPTRENDQSEDAARDSDREADTGDPDSGKDQGQADDPKDERRPDRGLPDKAQHLGVGHAGGLARHGGALQGEADPGSQQREHGKHCRLPDQRAVQPAGLVTEDDADQHEPGACENPEIDQKTREGRSQLPGVGHRSLHPEGEGVAHGVSVAREAAPFDPVEAVAHVRQRHHEAGRE